MSWLCMHLVCMNKHNYIVLCEMEYIMNNLIMHNIEIYCIDMHKCKIFVYNKFDLLSKS